MSEEYTAHPLNTTWTVWYHNPADMNWSPDSYKDILEIHSLEDYLVLKNSWNKCLPATNEGMYFMMRKFKDGRTIFPLWEDEYNKNGGYWSFKLDKDRAQEVWFNMMAMAIGEMVVSHEDHIWQINGISISPKKGFCIIKIWNQNRSFSNGDILNPELGKIVNLSDLLYSSHDNNIERDNASKQRRAEYMSNQSNGRSGSHASSSSSSSSSFRHSSQNSNRPNNNGNRHSSYNSNTTYSTNSSKGNNRDRDREQSHDDEFQRPRFKGFSSLDVDDEDFSGW